MVSWLSRRLEYLPVLYEEFLRVGCLTFWYRRGALGPSAFVAQAVLVRRRWRAGNTLVGPGLGTWKLSPEECFSYVRFFGAEGRVPIAACRLEI